MSLTRYQVCQVFSGVGVEASTTQLQRRHLLVLVNPVSGQGKAVQEFQEQVRPLFELAEINFTAVVTGEDQLLVCCEASYYSRGILLGSSF